MFKQIRNLTIEELVYYCGKNLNNGCEKCHFNHNGHCMTLIDFGIIDLDNEIELNIPIIELLKPKRTVYPRNNNFKYQCENEDLRQKISALEKQIDVERWQGLAYWEDFNKLKKFVLYFKRNIEEGLKGNYKKGENIIYDSLLNEFGKSFLNDLLQEVLNEKN